MDAKEWEPKLRVGQHSPTTEDTYQFPMETMDTLREGRLSCWKCALPIYFFGSLSSPINIP